MLIQEGITPEAAGKYLEAGASHVIVTSYLFQGASVGECDDASNSRPPHDRMINTVFTHSPHMCKRSWTLGGWRR